MDRYKININKLKGTDSGFTDNHLNLQVFLTKDEENNLLQESLINAELVDKYKSTLVPDFIDMEKVCFEPMNNDNKLINEIDFNLHFRVKDENWCSSGYNWNQGIIAETTQLNRVMCEKPDDIFKLGFTYDDIRYQKEKVKKSFIRISFYDNINTISPNLISYNTIFLDSNDLFSSLIKNGITGTSDINVTAVTNDIIVKNRFNYDKSSEGFYLYLYNNEVTKEEPEKDIYMKVEFNHAGYNKVITFMKPYINNGKISVMEYGGDVNLNDYRYIKLKVKYLENERKYVYILDEDEQDTNVYAYVRDNKLIFNLFEMNLK